MRQTQFLDVVPAEEAHRIFKAAVQPAPLGEETVALGDALGRVLSRDVRSAVDVPGFDRSDVDGYAVLAADTFGAEETTPVCVMLAGETVHPGVIPTHQVRSGTATPIATGGVIPRGADAVVMVEYTQPSGEKLQIYRPVVPGAAISHAGTDIGAGETILHRRTRLTSRETGVLAAIGLAEIPVFRRPRVAILSTGDEIIPPGTPPALGQIYDSNAAVIGDAVRELGCDAVQLGIVPDNAEILTRTLQQALAYDFVLLSGGTSKGEGDLNHTVVGQLGPPGILVHGVALKPGKPLCLALIGKTPLAILPGFPTSAVFTFHEFVAPVLRDLAGQPPATMAQTTARLPLRVNSQKGRREYLLVNLVPGAEGLSAYPMGKGSGSVTTFSKADGFIAIDRNQELVEAGEQLPVTLIGAEQREADLIVIGSHCVGLDYLLSCLREAGWRTKFIPVGSQGGLAAARREECDVAGIHLLDEASGIYNSPFLDDTLTLQRGYGRRQGVLFRQGDVRFADDDLDTALKLVRTDPELLMINRNRGSGTRMLIDQLLRGYQPPGYHAEAKSHNAVAAAVAQARVDWGIAIENVARPLGLGFLPVQEEAYDFVIPKSRAQRPAVCAFCRLLAQRETHEALGANGLGMVLDMVPPPGSGQEVTSPQPAGATSGISAGSQEAGRRVGTEGTNP